MQLGRWVWFCAGKEQTCSRICLVSSQGEISGCRKVAVECDLHRLGKECRFPLQGLFQGVSRRRDCQNDRKLLTVMLSSGIIKSVQELFATVGRWIMELGGSEIVLWLETLWLKS